MRMSRMQNRSETPTSLRILTVPPCGWSDLGTTPRRVVEAASRYAARRSSPAPETAGMMAFLDLVARQSQLTAAG